MQEIGNLPAGVLPLPPGAFYPYELPQGDVEEPFEPISWFAIQESGRFYGPLNVEQLKEFLRRKLDQRIICSRDVIIQYTEDVAGLSMQLNNLRNRMNQIKASEKERTDFIINRIRDFDKALIEGKPLPVYIQHELNLSKAVREALQHIGSQGPLPESQLFNFIHTGVYDNQIRREELINQLRNFRLRIHDNFDIDKHKVKFIYGRVKKALGDIIKEMMTIR